MLVCTSWSPVLTMLQSGHVCSRATTESPECSPATVLSPVCSHQVGLAHNNRSDDDIGDEAGVAEGVAGDRGGAVVQQPGLHGPPLVGVPISRNHRVPHHHLLHHSTQAV